MKKTFNKIKLGLSAFWLSIISFFSRVFWQNFGMDQNLYWVPSVPAVYWVPSAESQTFVVIVIKIIQRLFIGVIFIVWIINFIKIRKTDDKTEKKEKLKRFIIIISILVVLIIACIIAVQLLKK